MKNPPASNGSGRYPVAAKIGDGKILIAYYADGKIKGSILTFDAKP